MTTEGKSSIRANRMADLIREEVASFMVKGNKDPRVGFITITHVTMTPDLHIARVYYSAYGTEAQKEETKMALTESAGKIRNHLAKSLTTKFIPRLEFHVDEGLEASYRVQDLLGKIEQERLARETSGEGVEDKDNDDVDDSDSDDSESEATPPDKNRHH